MIGSRQSLAGRIAVGLCCTALVATACSGRSPDTDSPSNVSGQASSVGITKATVTVGNVSTLSGPVPGLFQGAPNGVDAYFAMVNADGGVNGRTLKLTSADDALSCNENTTSTKELVEKTFAMVGSFSINDYCGAKVLAKNPAVPSVGIDLSDELAALDSSYSPNPTPGNATGFFSYAVDTLGASKVGLLYPTVIAKDEVEHLIAAMDTVGLDVVYQRAYGTTETDFTADLIRMRAAGVDYLDLTMSDDVNGARIVNAAEQQDWHPKVIEAATAYDPDFLTIADAKAAEGVYITQPYALFLGEDRKTVPGVDAMLTWVATTHPGFRPDLFTVDGWMSAALFVEALTKAGADPTREGLLTALSEIHSFDADGLLAPGIDVGKQTPTECWLAAQIKDGKFVRVVPADGKTFTCEPGGYYVPADKE